MTLETFFEKFDQFADAPDSVAKMRELVLRLATSGRIAEQDPADQPASQLLGEIYEVRDKLIRNGRARSRVGGTPIVAGDTIDLPPSWVRCMVSEVCDLQTGATPSRQEHRFFGGENPWLVSGDVNKGEIFECDGRITDKGLENSNCKLIPKDSVLIALNGQGRTRATVALLRIAATLNQSLVAMTPYSSELLLPEYVFWNLRGRYRAIRDITGQDQRRGLNMKLVGQLSLPVPPLAEQKRIVAKVGELMTLCDQLEAQQQEREARHAVMARAALARFADAPTPANLELLFHQSYAIDPVDLRKAILTLAVQGKLVPQDPNDEPAEEFLALNQKRTRKGKARGGSGGTEASDSATPFDLPPGWAWSRFPELGEFARGKSKHRPRNDPSLFVGGRHRLIQTGDVARANGTIQSYNSLYNEVGLAQSKMWPAGTLCITIAANIADSGVLGFEACFPDSVVGFIPAAPIPSVRYFEYFMRTAKERLEEFAPATAQRNINLGILEQMLVPVPPLAEQRRIVAKVDELMALVDDLEAQIAASRATAADLLTAVVAELTGPRQA